jgi:hypothetical protein
MYGFGNILVNLCQPRVIPTGSLDSQVAMGTAQKIILEKLGMICLASILSIGPSVRSTSAEPALGGQREAPEAGHQVVLDQAVRPRTRPPRPASPLPPRPAPPLAPARATVQVGHPSRWVCCASFLS